jgi:LysR family glycine cleavage system transcriptional activator
MLCPHTFYCLMLQPLLEAFHKENPQVFVHINHMPDILFPQVLVELQDHDSAILVGNGYWEGMDSHCLLTMSLAVFGAPGLLRHPVPFAELELISEYPWLHNREFPSGWQRFLAVAGKPGIKPLAGEITCDHVPDVIASALAGQGLMLLDTTIAKADSLEGRLLQVSGHALPALSYYLAIPRDKAKRDSVKLLRDFLLRQVELLKWPNLPSS